MARWRLLVLGGLIAIPLLALMGLGMYHLWSVGWSFWAWWIMSGCFLLAFFLAWRWQKHQRLLTVDFTPELHWTDRDRQAWHLVETKAKQGADLKSDQLISLPFYIETAQNLALELSRFYHPGASDPLASLTVPEILAVVELAAHDLGKMTEEYLPGGHLLTIHDLRRFKKMADWYPVARDVTWLISGLFSPLGTAVRYFASQAGMGRPWQMLQDNVVLWFYTAYVHRLGNYLIDVNSGRLRVGVRRYLELRNANVPLAPGQPATTPADPADAVRSVTFGILGQTKAGKSSLINTLLGSQQAVTDVLPATAHLQRFTLQPEGVPTRFQLLDTEGYGEKGPAANQMRAAEDAARQSDVILLVLHARNPARQADLDLLTKLRQFFEANKDLHRPPILAVLTHIDLLSPSMEWAPPYDWRQPTRRKEEQIQQAVAAVQEQLGPFLVAVLPVCTAPGKEFGVQDGLLPVLVGLLDQAHAVAFLRCLKAEIDADKMRRVFTQLLAVGKGLLSHALAEFAKPAK